jgi:hypothetical protein
VDKWAHSTGGVGPSLDINALIHVFKELQNRVILKTIWFVENTSGLLRTQTMNDDRPPILGPVRVDTLLGVPVREWVRSDKIPLHVWPGIWLEFSDRYDYICWSRGKSFQEVYAGGEIAVMTNALVSVRTAADWLRSGGRYER